MSSIQLIEQNITLAIYETRSKVDSTTTMILSEESPGSSDT
jgi:hypothetical protein